MGGASPFLALLCISGFMMTAWFSGKVSQKFGVSAIIAEIATGVLMGPRLLGLIYPEYDVCQRQREVSCDPPDNLSNLIANGDPLGEVYGRISEMEYCPLEHYFPEEEELAKEEEEEQEEEGHGGHGHDEHGNHTLRGGGSYPNRTRIGTKNVNKTQVNESLPFIVRRGRDYRGNHTKVNGKWQRRRLMAHFNTYEECLEKSCLMDVAEECENRPDAFTLIGHAGISLMVFEGGMHFDFETAKVVGVKACIVATVGTLLPQIAGAALTMMFGRPLIPDGISVGTAIAPTSIGVSLQLLQELGALNEEFGQAIITAAFVDDILAMVSFNILFSLGGDFDVMATVVFPALGCAFSILAMVLAVKFWPAVFGMILPRIDALGSPDAKVPLSDEFLFLSMWILMFTYAGITYFLGTHLWGCFMAGVSFACLLPPHHAHAVWERQTKRIMKWMTRIFFACTVAFAIPADKLISFSAMWKGVLMAVGPTILTKVFCAMNMGKAKYVIGWGMVGRGEFAFLIAQMAVTSNMIDEEMFAVVIWALLIATVVTPFAFKPVLLRYLRDNGVEVGDKGHGHGPAPKGIEFEHGQSEVHQETMHYVGSKIGAGDPDLEGVHVEWEEGAHSGQASAPPGDEVMYVCCLCPKFFPK